MTISDSALFNVDINLSLIHISEPTRQLHCNGKLSEMKVVGNNSPMVSNFIIKKTSLFYKILS